MDEWQGAREDGGHTDEGGAGAQSALGALRELP